MPHGGISVGGRHRDRVCDQYALVNQFAAGFTALVTSGLSGAGAILLHATDQPTSFAAQLVQGFKLPLALVSIDSQQWFSVQSTQPIDMREWVTFAHAAESDTDEGLMFVDPPSGVSHP